MRDQKASAQQSNNELKKVLGDFIDRMNTVVQRSDEKVAVLEKRVDKIYTIGSLAVFVIGPLISILLKFILTKLGM